MNRNLSLCALLLLALPAALPSADAAEAPQDPVAHHVDVCLLGAETLEWYGGLMAADALGSFLASCFGHGVTAPMLTGVADTVPDAGVVLMNDGERNAVGVTHGYLLGGAVVVSLYEAHARVTWSQGITSCWIDVPGTLGAQCVY